MPKSKRQKVVSLTKTDRLGKESKGNLMKELQQCVDEYDFIYIFSVHNMRNAKLKEVRTAWRKSRFFFGKNKVMSIALGRTESEEYRPGLRHISEALVGNVGMLFTSDNKSTVKKWFAKYGEPDYARSGNVATDTITVKAGPQSQFSHTMEPQLRKLGLPTSLKRGIVTLDQDYLICTKGDSLTPEQARVLKLFGHQMATFTIELQSVWHDGSFEMM